MGSRLYAPYRNDLIENYNLVKRERLLSIILADKAKENIVMIDKDSLCKYIRVKPERQYKTLTKTLDNLVKSNFIEIVEENKTSEKVYLKLRVIPDLKTVEGQQTPYIQIPINILYDVDSISTNDVLVLMSLFYRQYNGKNELSYSQISNITGLDKSTIRKVLRSLEEKKLIKKKGEERKVLTYILGESRRKERYFEYKDETIQYNEFVYFYEEYN